jgi:DNA repair exonuclease SbcCD ATPase subunit
MPKGITQEQVSAAADALVAASERPTVEKIRAQLGTGSPNTVTRMLEAWRGALAIRMGQMLVLPEVPGDVGQAFAEVWRLAVTHAATIAQASLAQEQNALLAAQTSLTQERKIWEIAIAEARELAQSTGQAREVAETRLTDVQRLVEQQAGQLAELVQQRDGLQQRADQLAEAFDTHKSVVTAEREAQAVHVRAVEDRAHAEVDRSRFETKTLQTKLDRVEREASATSGRLEKALSDAREGAVQAARAKTLEQQLARMDGLSSALVSAQHSLQAAEGREAKLREQLNKLNAANPKVVARKKQLRSKPSR